MYYYILAFIIFLASACSNKPQTYFEDGGKIFHTTYSIEYKHTHSLAKEIEEKLSRFDDSLNPFKATSVISKVNNNEPVVLDTFFINVFNKAQEVSAISDGLFDITVSPLINAWGFGFKNMENLTDEKIDSLKQLTGYKKIALRDGKIYKDNPNIQINTSAIAKGYSSDVIAHLLESHGVKSYMVNIGGEIRAEGVSPKGGCWNVGITQPVDKGIFDYEHLQTAVQLCGKSMATSGNYRKYYIKNNKKYSHTINPKTGYPSESNILSATVIANDCMTADAYATVFMLTDTARTRAIARVKNMEYLLILGTSDSTFISVGSSYFKK